MARVDATGVLRLEPLNHRPGPGPSAGAQASGHNRNLTAFPHLFNRLSHLYIHNEAHLVLVLDVGAYLSSPYSH
jgi:hypothetical protein